MIANGSLLQPKTAAPVRRHFGGFACGLTPVMDRGHVKTKVNGWCGGFDRRRQSDGEYNAPHGKSTQMIGRSVHARIGRLPVFVFLKRRSSC
jgi:hypothetical protein